MTVHFQVKRRGKSKPLAVTLTGIGRKLDACETQVACPQCGSPAGTPCAEIPRGGHRFHTARDRAYRERA